MKKIVNNFLNFIKSNWLKFFSFILLLLWMISPIVEYIFKNNNLKLYTKYFSSIIYVIGICGIILYIIYLFRFRKKYDVSVLCFIPEILLLLLVFISVISSLLSKNTYLSFLGEGYRKEGLIVYIMYIGFILLSSIIKDSKYMKYLLKCMIISCLIITISPLFRNNFTYNGFINIFHNTNHYGYYLMINVMIALFMYIGSDKLVKRIIYALIYIFFLYLLIRNDTFGSYLAAFITLIFLFVYSMIKKYKRLKVFVVLLLFIATSFVVSNYDIKFGERVHFESTRGIVWKNFLIFKKDVKGFVGDNEYLKDTAGSSRGILWIEAMNYTLEHPLIGGGMECLKTYYLVDRGIFYGRISDRPHNIILQVSSFIGIPGAVIYLSLIIYIAIANLVIMKDNHLHILLYCTAMCYFISSLFGNSMYYTSPYFMIFLGSLIGIVRCNNGKKTIN